MPIEHYPFTLPPLPYAYNALEPYIDTETMYYHHDKHFAAYVDNLNKALIPYPMLQQLTLEQLLSPLTPLPAEAQDAILHNAGGVYNHTLYFAELMPKSPSEHQPSRTLEEAITLTFGSPERFKATFNAAALEVFGSGWVSLVLTQEGGLEIIQLHNQEVALPARTLITIDVWEHAYYLKYKNARADYVNSWWNVVRVP